MASQRDKVAEILADWEREAPDLQTATIAVVGRVLRAARYLTREIERELARFGLGIHDFNALLALRRQGAPYELTPSELSEALLFTSGGLTKLLERLEQAGYVQRAQDESDKRVVRVRLTDAGYAVEEEAMQAHLANQERLLEPLSADQRETIAAVLEQLLLRFDLGPEAWRRAQPPAGVTQDGGRS